MSGRDYDDPNRTAGIGEHWMDEVPGWTDLADPERSDKDYDRAVYEGNLAEDGLAISELGKRWQLSWCCGNLGQRSTKAN